MLWHKRGDEGGARESGGNKGEEEDAEAMGGIARVVVHLPTFRVPLRCTEGGSCTQGRRVPRIPHNSGITPFLVFRVQHRQSSPWPCREVLRRWLVAGPLESHHPDSAASKGGQGRAGSKGLPCAPCSRATKYVEPQKCPSFTDQLLRVRLWLIRKVETLPS